MRYSLRLSWFPQDLFLDSLHTQNMESHRDVLTKNGVDVDSIAPPDLSLVGDWLGTIGEPLAALVEGTSGYKSWTRRGSLCKGRPE